MCRGGGICCVMEPGFKPTTTAATTIFQPCLLVRCPLSQKSMKLTYSPGVTDILSYICLPSQYCCKQLTAKCLHWGGIWSGSLLQNILQSDELIGTQAELPFASPKWFWLISLQKDHWWIFPFISKLITRWRSFALLCNNPVGDSWLAFLSVFYYHQVMWVLYS